MGRAREELTPGPALEATLRRGVPPLVALVGDEDFLKEEALRQVRGALGEDTEVEAFDGPKNDQESAAFDPARVFDGLRTGRLFGGALLVAVRRADRFIADASDALGRLFEHPVRGAVLVLFLSKLDGRTRLAKALAKTGLKVACKPLYDRPAPWMAGKVPEHDHDLSRWTQARAQNAGKRMRLEVAHALTQHTGNDLGKIAGTIDTLVLFVSDRPEIDAGALGELVRGTGEQTMFRICDEILERDAAKALRTLETTYRSGLEMRGDTVRDPQTITLIILGQLSRRLRTLYGARRAFEEGVAPAEVMQRYGPTQTGLQSRFGRELSRFDAGTLRRTISGLRRMEEALKTGGAGAGPVLMLETYVVHLCRGRPPARAFPSLERRGGGRRWG